MQEDNRFITSTKHTSDAEIENSLRPRTMLLARNLLYLLNAQPQESDCLSPASCVALGKLFNLSVVLVWKMEL